MFVVKLCDLPPRFGLVKQAPEKPRTLDQLVVDDGCCNTSRISLCSRLAAAGLAPFGMRLRICVLRGGCCKMSFCDECAVNTTVGADVEAALVAVCDWSALLNGRDRVDRCDCEPGKGRERPPLHLLSCGPC